RLSSSSK
ncbi:eamA-like transporter family protein, partial [Vibrio harveyi]